MTELSQLEKARRAIKQSDLHASSDVEFSVADFSKDSVERLIAAMNEVRRRTPKADS